MELVLMEYVNEGLSFGFDPYYIYSIMVDYEEVGRIVLREGSDDQRYFDGHIGYSVFEEFRGHDYSYQACLLLKEIIMRDQIINKDHLIITCSPDNIASRRIIEKLGCSYIETKVIPHHLRKLFAEDEREKMIYIWNLK